jgi:hypothetical protein
MRAPGHQRRARGRGGRGRLVSGDSMLAQRSILARDRAQCEPHGAVRMISSGQEDRLEVCACPLHEIGAGTPRWAAVALWPPKGTSAPSNQALGSMCSTSMVSVSTGVARQSLPWGVRPWYPGPRSWTPKASGALPERRLLERCSPLLKEITVSYLSAAKQGQRCSRRTA